MAWDLFAALDGVSGIVEVVVDSEVGRCGSWVVTWIVLEDLSGEQLVIAPGEALAVLEALSGGYKSTGQSLYAWMVAADK